MTTEAAAPGALTSVDAVVSSAVTAVRLQTFSMPDVGEGLTEADVLDWRVAVGDTLAVNQVIVEIETAKAAVELPSPFAGRVYALLVQPGETVAVGTPIISIDTDPDAGDPVPGTSTPTGNGHGAGAKIGEVTADGRVATLVGYTSAATGTQRRPRRNATPPPAASADASDIPAGTADERDPAAAAERPASEQPGPQQVASERPVPELPAAHQFANAPLAAPPVRKLAKDLGIDLRAVHPSRPDGVISRADVETAAGAADLESAARPAGDKTATREHRVPVKGVRKATAAAMVASAFTAPHVTEFLTIDVTPLMELRDRLRRRPEFAELKVTPLAFVARAVCLAIRRTPEINSVYEPGDPGAGDQILVKQYVNLGIAAATPRGLIVPVIRDADALDLVGLARALDELTATARAGHTTPAEMTGSTFSITNVGVFGIDAGTPIINPGEAAILAVGSIKDAPWVVDGQLAVRKVCQLSLSFDHRIVDGLQGSRFLSDVGTLLSDPGMALAF